MSNDTDKTNEITTTVKIMGIDYSVIFVDNEIEGYPNLCGLCLGEFKRIYVVKEKTSKYLSMTDCIESLTQTCKHELIHAFLYMSGLHASSLETDHWALNEEMIDWFAIQWDYINDAVRELSQFINDNSDRLITNPSL